MCNITKDNVAHEPFLVCSDASSHFVTYRSGVSATSDDVGSQMLVSYIEDWVSSGPTVHVRGTLMKIDNECSVSITSYVDDLCADVATTASEISASTSTNNSQQSTDISGAIVGGILSVLVIAISQIVLVVLLCRGCHGKQLFRKTEQYVDVYL